MLDDDASMSASSYAGRKDEREEVNTVAPNVKFARIAARETSCEAVDTIVADPEGELA